MKQAILVLGMHRSGTSALTRVLSLLGATLPKHLMPPVAGINETGFWEPERLAVLHDQMLAESGSRWDDWRPLNLEAALPPARLQYYKAEISRLINDDYGEVPLFILKEPRICRFASFYADILASMKIDVQYVIIMRNPLAVAASLLKRDGLTPGYSSLLWLRHVLDAEHATRGIPRVLISYENLMSDWRNAVDKIMRKISVDWPRHPDEAATDIDAFLSPELRHCIADKAQLFADKNISTWVKDAYASLTILEQDVDNSASLVVLSRIRTEFDTAAQIFGYPFYSELAARERMFAHTRKITDENAAKITQLNTTITQISTDLTARETLFVQEKKSLSKEIFALRPPTSWKLTYPIRLVGSYLFRTKQKM